MLIHTCQALSYQQDIDNKTLKTVTLQLKWRHQFQFAGYYIAKEKGFYQQAGLDVKLLERLPGPGPIEQLMYGEADYAIGGVGAMIYRANDVPLSALATIFQKSPSILISRYPKLADLINNKVMLTKGLMNAEIIALFKQNNIAIEQLNIVPTTQALSEFTDGNIDAYNIYSSNELYQLNQSDLKFYVFYPGDYGIDFYGDVLLTMEKNIRDNPQEVEAFIAASIKGWEYAINHVDEAIELIREKYNTQNKSQQELAFEADSLIKLIYADIIPVGYMNPKRWQRIEHALRELGSFKGKSVDLNRFIYSPPKPQSSLALIRQYRSQILAALILIFGVGLIWHNRSLKIEIKQHTKLLQQAKEQAERDARTDPLTQLANRRKFLESIEHDMSIAERNNMDLSIIYIDIDLFKTVNDTYGHAAGDRILKELAEIFTKNTRPSENIARIGGEEFAITCLGKNTESAVSLASRIREAVEEHRFKIEQDTLNITVSLGVASLTKGISSDELLKRTDDALYRAKHLGRNQVQVA